MTRYTPETDPPLFLDQKSLALGDELAREIFERHMNRPLRKVRFEEWAARPHARKITGWMPHPPKDAGDE